jgi:hypothetical protein
LRATDCMSGPPEKPRNLFSNQRLVPTPHGAIIKGIAGSGCRMNAHGLNGLRKIQKPLPAHSAKTYTTYRLYHTSQHITGGKKFALGEYHFFSFPRPHSPPFACRAGRWLKTPRMAQFRT